MAAVLTADRAANQRRYLRSNTTYPLVRRPEKAALKR
jgi:hypothetical protein